MWWDSEDSDESDEEREWKVGADVEGGLFLDVIDEMVVGVDDDGFEFVVIGVLKTSTGFLERFLPLCMCLSQYFESANASFEHLHFFPSVLLHLPGSGSTFLPKPIWKQLHPTAKSTQT